MLKTLTFAALVAASPTMTLACETRAKQDATDHQTGAMAAPMMGSDGDDMPMMAGDAPMVHDAYARAATPNARAGAAFMVLMNPTSEDDQLIGARSDVAARVEIHTHIKGDDGVMKMRKVEGGLTIPAGGSHVLARGGDHIMFMGLKQSFDQGKEIPVTLIFEQAGEIDVSILVDLEREDHGEMDHSQMDHGEMTHGHSDH